MALERTSVVFFKPITGMWFEGKKSGYGVLTKRNGDHFEGHWIEDMREGHGSYFFCSKN